MRPKLLTKCLRKSLSDKFYPNLEICIEMYVGYILTDLYMLLCYFYIVPYWLWDVKVCFVVYIQTFHEYLQGKVKLMKILIWYDIAMLIIVILKDYHSSDISVISYFVC